MTGPAHRALTSDGVTEETAKALRAAMQRLFAGKPQRTDGRIDQAEPLAGGRCQPGHDESGSDHPCRVG